MCFCKYLLLLWGGLFIITTGIFQLIKILNYNEVQLINISPLWFVIFVFCQGILPLWSWRSSRLSSHWGGGVILGEEMATTPVFLHGKSHGQRSMAAYSLWGHKESDTTEWLNNSHEDLPGCLLEVLLLYLSCLYLQSIWNWFLCMRSNRVKALVFFSISYPMDLAPFHKKIIFSLPDCRDTFIVNQVFTYAWVCVYALYSTAWVFFSISNLIHLKLNSWSSSLSLFLLLSAPSQLWPIRYFQWLRSKSLVSPWLLSLSYTPLVIHQTLLP